MNWLAQATPKYDWSCWAIVNIDYINMTFTSSFYMLLLAQWLQGFYSSSSTVSSTVVIWETNTILLWSLGFEHCVMRLSKETCILLYVRIFIVSYCNYQIYKHNITLNYFFLGFRTLLILPPWTTEKNEKKHATNLGAAQLHCIGPNSCCFLGDSRIEFVAEMAAMSQRIHVWYIDLHLW